jgi:hypothetical protein
MFDVNYYLEKSDPSLFCPFDACWDIWVFVRANNFGYC